MTNEDLAREIETQKALMISVATGGLRIDDVNAKYMERRATISVELQRRDLSDPNPHGDLWDWYTRWSSGDMSSWAKRRAYIAQMYQPTIDRVRSQDRAQGPQPHTPVTASASNNLTSSAPPRVFVSYSHDSLEHKQWVLNLAERLRAAGVDIGLDQWDLRPGMDIPAFMERSLTQADRVIVILTDAYVRKSDERTGGAGYETVMMTSEILANLDTSRFIPVVRQAGSPRLPRGFGARYYIDFNVDRDFDSSVIQLLRELHAEPELKKPPLGPNPFATSASSPSSVVAYQPDTQQGGDRSRWRKLLETAKSDRIWVELESPIFTEFAVASGRTPRNRASISGYIAVWRVAEDTFELGIPISGRGGITMLATPYSVVEDIWMGTEQRLHVTLRKAILVKDGSSAFI